MIKVDNVEYILNEDAVFLPRSKKLIMLIAYVFMCQPHVYVLSRYTFQSDTTSLVNSYDIYYADSVKYINFVDNLYIRG